MKKVLLLALTLFSVTATARDRHWSPPHHHSAPYSWVLPAVIGGAIVYSVTRPAPVIVQQLPIYYPPTPQYREQWIYDTYCQCWVKALVPVTP